MKKIDFTVATAKAFVNTMSKAYQGYFGVSKVRADLAKVVKNNKAVMDSDSAKVELTPEDHPDYARFVANLADSTARYERTKAKLDKAVEVESKRINEAKALFDVADLYNAYVDYVNNGLIDDTAYADALAKIFVSNGLADATADNVRRYLNAVGTANGNAYKDKSVLKAKTKSVWADVITRAIVQSLIESNGIDTSKYTYYVKPAKKSDK